MAKRRELNKDSDKMFWGSFNPSRDYNGQIILDENGEPKSAQLEFLESRAKFICGSGGYGGGKSFILVRRAIALLINTPWFGDMSGNVGVIGRYKLSDFEKTTLPELIRAMPKQWIRKHYRKDGIIELVNESVLHYTHFDSKEHLNSYNLGFAAIDQMEELPWEVFEALAYERIRRTSMTRYNSKGILIVPKLEVNENGETICVSTDPEEIAAWLRYQCIFGVCNPKRGWIHEKFVKNDMYCNSTVPSLHSLYNPLYKLITLSTYDNIANLPSDYIKNQQTDKSTREFKRSVLGAWDAFLGQIYEDFTDDLINEKNEVPNPYSEIIVGIDHGGSGTPDHAFATNVTGVVFMAITKKLNQYPDILVFDELFLPSKTIEETVALIHEKLIGLNIAQKYRYPEIMTLSDMTNRNYTPIHQAKCDPNMQKHMEDSTETFITTYIRHAQQRGLSLPLSPGGSGITERIHKINWMFRKKMVRINPKCGQTINQLKSFEYGSNEKPRLKQCDHNVNALEYAMTSLSLWFQDTMLIKEKSREEMAMERYNQQLDMEGSNRLTALFS